MSEAFEKLAESERKARDLLQRAEQCLRYKDPEGVKVADEISEFLYGKRPADPYYERIGKGAE